MGNDHTSHAAKANDQTSHAAKANGTTSALPTWSGLNGSASISSITETPSTPARSPLSRVASVEAINSRARSPSVDELYLTKSKSLHRRQASALIIVNNGITGKYISSRICKIAARFWTNYIDYLPISEQLEIGCSIFFGMMASKQEMANILRANMPKERNFEKMGLRYLDMMGWCIRNTIVDNIDLFGQMTKLGSIHKAMGIEIEHYAPMLEAMHETFAYYFGSNYTIEIKYALDEIFSLTAQIMTGDIESHFKDLNQQFAGDNIPFLHSLDACLKSSIGSEYLYRFLSQTWCDEIVMFLQSISRFRGMISDKERYIMAKDITALSIQPSAKFALNLSYATRHTILCDMAKLEELFVKKQSFQMDTKFFAQVEADVKDLIQQNHWVKFVQGIEVLKLKSFNVEFKL
eukprot:276514_1